MPGFGHPNKIDTSIYPVLRIIPPPCLMLSWRCHFEFFVGRFRLPFWSLWANFVEKGTKMMPFERPFSRLWGHFHEKCLKIWVCCKVRKAKIEKVKKTSFSASAFGVHFCQKPIERVTRNRLWDRSMFYCILGVPVIEKKVSGRCRMRVLHVIKG